MNRLVIRVMEGDPEAESHGRMLGWQETLGEARGDGQLWAAQTFQVPIETAGLPGYVSVHWVDVNVEVRVPLALDAVPVQPGDLVTPLMIGQPIFRIGPQASGLPGITTRGPVTVHLQAGRMGIVGNV